MKLSELKEGQYCSNESLPRGSAITFNNNFYKYVYKGEIRNALTVDQLKSNVNTENLYISDSSGKKLEEKTSEKDIIKLIGGTYECIESTGSISVGDRIVAKSFNREENITFIHTISGIKLLNGKTTMSGWHWNIKNFKYIDPSKDKKRNLAFYKKSKKYWTQEEFDNISKYCGSSICKIDFDKSFKYIFDYRTGIDEFMWGWGDQEYHKNFYNCIDELAYEDIFTEEEKITDPKHYPKQELKYSTEIIKNLNKYTNIADGFTSAESCIKSLSDIKLEEALSRISALEEQLLNKKENIMANQEKTIMEQLQEELCCGQTPKVKKAKTPKIVCNVKGEFMTFKNEDELKSFMWTSREKSVIRYDLGGTVTVPFELQTKAPKQKA